MSCATIVHVSHTQAALVKLLPLTQHHRPPITGLKQWHGAFGRTQRGSAPRLRVPYVEPAVDEVERGTMKGAKEHEDHSGREAQSYVHLPCPQHTHAHTTQIIPPASSQLPVVSLIDCADSFSQWEAREGVIWPLGPWVELRSFSDLMSAEQVEQADNPASGIPIVAPPPRYHHSITAPCQLQRHQILMLSWYINNMYNCHCSSLKYTPYNCKNLSNLSFFEMRLIGSNCSYI